MIIYGINPVSEAIKAATVSTVWVSARRDARLRQVVTRARLAAVRVEHVEADELDRLAAGGAHQGVVARVAAPAAHSVADLVGDASRAPLVVVLDGVEDPQNFGAVIRTSEAAGVDGIVYQKRRAAPKSGAAAKASAGALSYVRMAPVVNVSRAITELKKLGVWTVGLDADVETPYYEIDLVQPTALVVGAEGTGLRRLVHDRCDLHASIPMLGQVASLNVSVATGVVLYEAVRQRRLGSARGG